MYVPIRREGNSMPQDLGANRGNVDRRARAAWLPVVQREFPLEWRVGGPMIQRGLEGGAEKQAGTCEGLNHE